MEDGIKCRPSGRPHFYVQVHTLDDPANDAMAKVRGAWRHPTTASRKCGSSTGTRSSMWLAKEHVFVDYR